MVTDHNRYMRYALEQAREAERLHEAPIGAIVVRDGQILAAAHNWRETWHDPTAHAELIAIREASRALGGWRLIGCKLYVTLEPCAMCAGAILLSRVEEVVFGASDSKGGAAGSTIDLLNTKLFNHQPKVTAGILADECGMILTSFFKGLRTMGGKR